jgi:hypothetical protein
MQSDDISHTCPISHWWHVKPPQSTSVSKLFFILSLQFPCVGFCVGSFVGAFVGAAVGTGVGNAVGIFVGAAVGVVVGTAVGVTVGLLDGASVTTAAHTELEHWLDAQSDWISHPCPSKHFPLHVKPPQSTSVSKPSFTPFTQGAAVGVAVGVAVGASVTTAAHTELEHWLDAQSDWISHPCPSKHFPLHVKPPQSTSVSKPSFTPLLHGELVGAAVGGAWHFAAEHDAEKQSESSSHVTPVPHL